MRKRDDLSDLSQLLAAFSQTSSIELAVYDNQLRFQAVNNAAAAITGTPAEAFFGKTLRDIIGDAAPGPETRLRRVLESDGTPSVEVIVMLPTRTEPGYWIEKNFPIKGRAGRAYQIVSLAVEVTAHRKLEQSFQRLAGELLWTKSNEYSRLAGELHHSIDKYNEALAVSLERLSRHCREPEKIPELWAQSMEVLGERVQRLMLTHIQMFSELIWRRP
ncbi:MAG TPA: PAS domain-containing protein [Terriglobales bacterium]|jgi:transcriptional regulator with PAS, ATPase and Fis domain|nr:PAS domain-containing protein [Terriglobales bacterium]